MSDLVIAVLQLTSGSSRDGPAESQTVRPEALGGGIFSQTLSNKLPDANQVSISYLQRTESIRNLCHGWFNKHLPLTDRLPMNLHLAAAADFSQPQIFCRCVLGRVDLGPRSKLEP